MSRPKVTICPFCGETQPLATQCRQCRLGLDAPSRQTAQRVVGTWFVRDPLQPHLPGLTYAAIAERIMRGDVGRNTIVRSPTTRQLWTVARHVPGLAHLLGYCHACDAHVEASATSCPRCACSFDPRELEESKFSPEHGGAKDALLPPGHGISSLVPDDQLRSPALGPVATIGPASPPPAAPHAEHRAEPAVQPIDLVITHPLVRSLQRQLARAERRVHMLLMLCAVLLVTAGGAALALIDTRREAKQESLAMSERDDESEVMPLAPKPEVREPIARPADPVVTESRNPEAGSVDDAENSASPKPAPTAEPTEAPTAEVTAAWARVQELAATARDTRREIAERRGAIKGVLVLLDAQRAIPAAQRDAQASDEAIASLSDEFELLSERLAVEEFFPPVNDRSAS